MHGKKLLLTLRQRLETYNATHPTTTHARPNLLEWKPTKTNMFESA